MRNGRLSLFIAIFAAAFGGPAQSHGFDTRVPHATDEPELPAMAEKLLDTSYPSGAAMRESHQRADGIVLSEDNGEREPVTMVMDPISGELRDPSAGTP